MAFEDDFFEIEMKDGVTVVRFTVSRFDSSNFQRLAHPLYRKLDESGSQKIAVDMKKVDYLFSESLGNLVSLQRRVQDNKGKLVLFNVQDAIVELLEVTHLHTLFTFADDEASALTSFQ